MDYSLPGWLGALAGTIVAVVVYLPAIRIFERHMRAQQTASTLESRADFETMLSVYRRLILGVDIAILASLGYWIGNVIGAAGSAPPLR
jgi:hypothetical protein